MTREGTPLYVRLPHMTTYQIEVLCARLGLTKTQLVIVAMDRMMRDLQHGAISPDASSEAIDDAEDADATA